MIEQFHATIKKFKNPNNVSYQTIQRESKYQDTCVTLAELMLNLTPNLPQKITPFELGECLWFDYLLLAEHTQIEFAEYFQDVALFCVGIQTALQKSPANDWWLAYRIGWMLNVGFERDELITYTTPKRVNFKRKGGNYGK